MTKEELLSRITESDGKLRISSLSSMDEGEHVISMAKLLEHQGMITLEEYCIETEPVAVSLQTKLCI